MRRRVSGSFGGCGRGDFWEGPVCDSKTWNPCEIAEIVRDDGGPSIECNTGDAKIHLANIQLRSDECVEPFQRGFGLWEDFELTPGPDGF